MVTTVGLLEVAPAAGPARWVLRLRIEDGLGAHLPEDGSVPDGPEEMALDDFAACFLDGDADAAITLETATPADGRGFERVFARILADRHAGGYGRRRLEDGVDLADPADQFPGAAEAAGDDEGLARAELDAAVVVGEAHAALDQHAELGLGIVDGADAGLGLPDAGVEAAGRVREGVPRPGDAGAGEQPVGGGVRGLRSAVAGQAVDVGERHARILPPVSPRDYTRGRRMPKPPAPVRRRCAFGL